MRSIKLLTKYTAVLAILVVAFGPFGVLQQTPVAHAAPSSLPDFTNINTYNPISLLGNAAWAGVSYVGSTWAAPAASAVATNVILPALSKILYWLASALVWFLGITAGFFDTIIRVSLNSTAYALNFLTESWTLVLSLANMFFIFILIYTAFVIMLRAETTRTMQVLAWVIAIALVVNFSFFLTRIAIDSGNILATQFYNATVSKLPPGPNGPPQLGGVPDLTAGIMNAVGFQQLLGSDSFAAVQKVVPQGGEDSVSSIVYLSTIIICLILITALAAVAIKFLVRIVGLWLVLISSPLAFVTKTLNQTQHFFDMWFRTLIGFAFYPPIFLFIFYVLTLIMVQLAGPGTIFNSLQTVAQTDNSLTLVTLISSVIIRLGFVIVLLFIGLKASDWIVEQIGGLAATVMNKASSAVLGGGFRMAAGTAGWAARNTVGRGGQRLAESNWLRNKATQNGLAGTLWRSTSRLSGAVGRSSLDVRNAPGGSILNKGASALAGGNLNVGKASDKSFAELDKKRADRKEAEGKAFKPSKANIEIAQQAEIEKLTDAKKQELANAAKAYDTAKKNADEVGDEGSKRALRTAKLEFDRQMKPVNDAVEKATGAGNADSYAQTITTPSLRNLWMPSKAAYEAASKLRDTKNKGGGVLATLKKVAPHITPEVPIPPPPTTTPTPTPTPTRASTIIPASDVAPNPLTDEERARRRAPGTGAAPTTTPPVIGPGGSAFDKRTAAQKIASEPDPTRREKLEEDYQNMMQQDLGGVIKATENQQQSNEKLAGAIEKLGQKIASSQQNKPAAEKTSPMWKAPENKSNTVKLDDKSMRIFKTISKELKNGFHKSGENKVPPESKPQINIIQNKDHDEDKKEGA